jgi:hypothetical protein
MGQYHSIFEDNYKIEILEWFFTERYAADKYTVPEEDYREIYWGRVACEFFVIYVIFSVLAFEAP